jgi:phosphoglycolate phosphatase
VPTIVVRFGFSTEPVESLGAAAVIDHYDALVPTLAALALAHVAIADPVAAA